MALVRGKCGLTQKAVVTASVSDCIKIDVLHLHFTVPLRVRRGFHVQELLPIERSLPCTQHHLLDETTKFIFSLF